MMWKWSRSREERISFTDGPHQRASPFPTCTESGLLNSWIIKPAAEQRSQVSHWDQKSTSSRCVWFHGWSLSDLAEFNLNAVATTKKCCLKGKSCPGYFFLVAGWGRGKGGQFWSIVVKLEIIGKLAVSVGRKMPLASKGGGFPGCLGQIFSLARGAQTCPVGSPAL